MDDGSGSDDRHNPGKATRKYESSLRVKRPASVLREEQRVRQKSLRDEMKYLFQELAGTLGLHPDEKLKTIIRTAIDRIQLLELSIAQNNHLQPSEPVRTPMEVVLGFQAPAPSQPVADDYFAAAVVPTSPLDGVSSPADSSYTNEIDISAADALFGAQYDKVMLASRKMDMTTESAAASFGLDMDDDQPRQTVSFFISQEPEKSMPMNSPAKTSPVARPVLPGAPQSASVQPAADSPPAYAPGSDVDSKRREAAEVSAAHYAPPAYEIGSAAPVPMREHTVGSMPHTGGVGGLKALAYQQAMSAPPLDTSSLLTAPRPPTSVTYGNVGALPAYAAADPNRPTGAAPPYSGAASPAPAATAVQQEKPASKAAEVASTGVAPLIPLGAVTASVVVTPSAPSAPTALGDAPAASGERKAEAKDDTVEDDDEEEDFEVIAAEDADLHAVAELADEQNQRAPTQGATTTPAL